MNCLLKKHLIILTYVFISVDRYLLFLLEDSSSFSCQNSKHYKFNDGFSFGVATSSYQVEGAWNISGKGFGLWDVITQNGNLIVDGSSGNVACNSYYKIDEDIQLLKELGVNHYRFSIAWTRILPTGNKNNLNLEGLVYYDNLINKLLKNGIKPWITIYHFDHPYILETSGGWANPDIAQYLVDFADVLFAKFGDRVKTWITINEPYSVCITGGNILGYNPYTCSRNILRAHGAIWNLYKKKYRATQQGKLSMALNIDFNLPATNKIEDIEAADRINQFSFGLFIHPLVHGNYPQTVIDIVALYSKQQGYNTSRLQELSVEDLDMLKGSYDFIGFTTYNIYLITANNDTINSNPSFENDCGAISTKSTWNDSYTIEMGAKGLGINLKRIKNTYNNPEIRITEQGWQETNLMDYNRQNYVMSNMGQVLRSIHEDQVNVTAYTIWSLMDNFEWFEGYTKKFGLYSVDFNSLQRTRFPRKSALTYSTIIKQRYLDGL